MEEAFTGYYETVKACTPDYKTADAAKYNMFTKPAESTVDPKRSYADCDIWDFRAEIGNIAATPYLTAVCV